MLFGEWDMDVAKEVWQKEAREEGWEKGLEEGRREALEEVHKEIAKNALALGVSPATVAQATGLDLAAIKGLAAE